MTGGLCFVEENVNIENRVVGGHGGIVVVEEAWMYRV